MNGLRKISNAPGVDLVPAEAENQMLEKRFESRLQQVCDERQGTTFSGLIMLWTVASCSLPLS